jgi:hypothetical protein
MPARLHRALFSTNYFSGMKCHLGLLKSMGLWDNEVRMDFFAVHVLRIGSLLIEFVDSLQEIQ